MGKPIKKKNFGNPNLPTSSGKEITMQANLGNGIVSAWVIEQTSTSEYKLTDGIDITDCSLKESVDGVGDAVLTCYPYQGSPETVRVLTQHRMKTFEGSNYDWVDETSITGQAQLVQTEQEEQALFSADFFNVIGLENNTGIGANRFGDWVEGQTSSVSATAATQGGISPYTYKWQIAYEGISGTYEFSPPRDQPNILITNRDISNNLRSVSNGLSFNMDFELSCTIESDGGDSQVITINVNFVAR